MSNTGTVTPIYSQNAAVGTGTGQTVDVTAFTDDSSCLIKITGTATVELQGTVDYTNPNIWVVCGTYTADAWVTIPKRCAYMRTVTTAFSSGTVTSAFSRGIADDNKSVVSAQLPITMTTGAQ